MAFVLIGAGLMGLLAGTFTQYCDDHFPKIPKDKDTKRNLHLERQTSQPMLFAPRNLSNHEALYKLSGLKLSVTPWEDSSWEGAEDRILRGRVTGSKGQWNVLANITTSKSVHPRTAIDAGGGIQSGQLAFFHPDSNELVEGLWYVFQLVEHPAVERN